MQLKTQTIKEPVLQYVYIEPDQKVELLGQAGKPS